jgi:hypothetical protein
LAAISSLLVIFFKASVSGLIPLYAIGVFLSFTLSQTGMARRWWKSGHLKPGEKIEERGSTIIHENGWRLRMFINGFGAALTAIVMVIFAVTKFKDGAWIVVLITPLLVTGFFTIHKHYKSLASQLSLQTQRTQLTITRNRVIMPIGGVHQSTLAAMRYARKLTNDITAVYVSIDPVETEKVRAKWDMWGNGYRLVVLNSPYRMFFEPLLEYLDVVLVSCRPGEIITIIVPQFVSESWWTNLLHTRTAESLRKVLLNRDNVVITEVPYHVK